MDQLKILKQRHELVDGEIIPEFERLLGHLDEEASADMGRARSAAYSYDGIDYAKDCYVCARYEEAAFSIFESVLSKIGTTSSYIERKIEELSRPNSYKENTCMDCGKETNKNKLLECEACHRTIDRKCASKCEKCGKTVCKACKLFKYRGHTRCVECYEDIIRDHSMWVEDDWVENYHSYNGY